jgi:ABC-2 type transport system permease protein
MLNLIGKNLKEIFNNKKRIALIAFLPFFFFGLLAMVYKDTSVNKSFINPVEIGVVDNDNSIFSKLLLDHYQKNTVFTDFISIHMDGEIEDMFAHGELDGILIIPENFANNMMHMKHEPIVININTKDPIKSVMIKNILESYENYIRAVEQNVSLLYDMMRDYNFTVEEISVVNTEISYELIMTAMERNTFFEYIEIVDVPNTSSTNYFLISIIVLLIMYFGLYVGLDVIREREQQTLQRLEVMGYSKLTFILSKLLSHVLYLFTNISLWLILLSFILNISISLQLVFFLFVAIIFSVSYSIFIGGIFKNQESILLVGNIFNFIAALIGGSIIPLQFLPASVQRFSVFTPNYWFIRGLLFIQHNTTSILPNVVMGLFLSLSLLLIVLSSLGFEYLGDAHV